MAIPVNVSIEQLAETLNSLTVSEKEELKSLLDNTWFETEEVNQTISEILSKSTDQHREGKIRASEDVIRESKQKIWIVKIVWSNLAEKSYNLNLLYLSENWPLPVVQNFILDVEKTMNYLLIIQMFSGGEIVKRNIKLDISTPRFHFSIASKAITS